MFFVVIQGPGSQKKSPHPYDLYKNGCTPWYHHDMDTLSTLLALCDGNPPVTGGFPSQGVIIRISDICLVVRLNKLLSKQSSYWWSETSWRSRDVTLMSIPGPWFLSVFVCVGASLCPIIMIPRLSAYPIVAAKFLYEHITWLGLHR